MACIQHTLQHRNCHFSFSLCPRSRTFSAGEQMLPVGICSSTDSHVDNTQLPIRARSVKTVPIRIVSVGKNRKDGVDAITESYLVKIRRYCKVEDVQIRSNPSNTSDVTAQVEAEAEKVLRTISSKDWVILLDERGQQATSEKFASIIEDAWSRIPSALVFCIGGPYGHGSGVVQRANQSIRLSSMVLNHQVALIVLLEQVYRACTILRGEKYHH
ncbi:hypothetical protein KP509_28G069300 [Ceratopteris richardii]|uniref:RNA methyltransferase At5g10620 n=1 Tax=Ceratopteris richardii TaxID=49495 RepID=A0A8T2RFU1_CERRI|nr:hypothetical protein KP509_28G069300 [Ceratopteris richardii]